MKIRKAVFPVAGLGTRFLPATKAIPKEMLPVVDKPLIQYTVEEALSAGIEEIIFVTSRGKTPMEDHFDRAPELEEKLRCRGQIELLHQIESLVAEETWSVCSVRQYDPLGLGHAVWCARDLVGDQPFAVMLPDDLIQPVLPDGTLVQPVMKQMVEQFQQVQSPLMAVMEVPADHTNRYGILNPGGPQSAAGLIPIKGLVEKPKPADAPSRMAIIGRYILTPDIFGLLGQQRAGTGGEIQLTDAMAALLKNHDLYGYRFQGIRYDCGTKAGYQMGNLALALEVPELRRHLLPFMQERLDHWAGRTPPA
ncbi:MAG: UTP--glucose-1-phosphate uridylyltransferase GalU [Magnetococcales bacterium]|nr:UTP--glucose-1-phosphate uridylyltransferase GalU [Magnetococcales bacterium]MBF0321920.1 UTP--glucose-1-phosphate uridylyltransferase GalU [Magnetococcales bacterium]